MKESNIVDSKEEADNFLKYVASYGSFEENALYSDCVHSFHSGWFVGYTNGTKIDAEILRCLCDGICCIINLFVTSLSILRGF